MVEVHFILRTLEVFPRQTQGSHHFLQSLMKVGQLLTSLLTAQRTPKRRRRNFKLKSQN
uniref:Uncharacterized protein n=1 Tax=Lotus japonicus TaxID=34305 RepID=I3SL17_LOTJA|nr:unknown [Lotus japonicus]